MSEYDNMNVGKAGRWAIEHVLIGELGLSKTQATNHFHHTLKHAERDGTEVLKQYQADPVTKKRTAAINEPAQREYFSLVDDVATLLLKNSPGVDINGKSYTDLEEHFVWNLDEEIIIASLDGIKIYGAAAKHRHLRNRHDSRESIGIIRSGSAAGALGPNVYILDCRYRKKGHSDKWLVEEAGNPPGSFIYPNNIGYLDTESWEEAAPRIARAMRSAPVVCDHPTWWIRVHLDGLQVHANSVKANMTFFSLRIWIIIEWPHSSHVNQAFDDTPAHTSKSTMRDVLPEVRDSLGMVTNRALDQWYVARSGRARAGDW